MDFQSLCRDPLQRSHSQDIQPIRSMTSVAVLTSSLAVPTHTRCSPALTSPSTYGDRPKNLAVFLRCKMSRLARNGRADWARSCPLWMAPALQEVNWRGGIGRMQSSVRPVDAVD